MASLANKREEMAVDLPTKQSPLGGAKKAAGGKRPAEGKSASAPGFDNKRRAMEQAGTPVPEENCPMCDTKAYLAAYNPMKASRICRNCAVVMQQAVMAFQSGTISTAPSFQEEKDLAQPLQANVQADAPIVLPHLSLYFEDNLKQLAKTCLFPENLADKLQWMQQQASVVPGKLVGELTQTELRDIAVKQRKFQAQKFMEHVERALGYSMDEESELPIHYPPFPTGWFAIFTVALSQDLDSAVFTSIAEAMYSLAFHLELHPHVTQPDTQSVIVWNRDAAQTKVSADALLSIFDKFDIQVDRLAEPMKMYSVKKHGLPGNRRQAQLVTEQEYTLKVAYSGHAAGKRGFTGSTLRHVVATVRNGVHIMVTPQDVEKEAEGASDTRNHLGLSYYGSKPFVSKARILFEDHGLKNGLSVTVDRRPPVQFVDGLKG